MLEQRLGEEGDADAKGWVWGQGPGARGWRLGGSGGLGRKGQGALGAGLRGSSSGGGTLLTSGISLAGGLTPPSSGSPPRTRL